MPFAPNNNANPKGRPKGGGVNPAAMAARQHADKAIAKLVAALDAENPETYMKAANSLLDRAWGKPKETMGFEDEDGKNPFAAIQINIVRASN